jgi:hypothetical protein
MKPLGFTLMKKTDPPLRVLFRWRASPNAADLVSLKVRAREHCYDCGDPTPKPHLRVPFVTQSETTIIIRAEALCDRCWAHEQLNPRYD